MYCYRTITTRQSCAPQTLILSQYCTATARHQALAPYCYLQILLPSRHPVLLLLVQQPDPAFLLLVQQLDSRYQSRHPALLLLVQQPVQSYPRFQIQSRYQSPALYCYPDDPDDYRWHYTATSRHVASTVLLPLDTSLAPYCYLRHVRWHCTATARLSRWHRTATTRPFASTVLLLHDSVASTVLLLLDQSLASYCYLPTFSLAPYCYYTTPSLAPYCYCSISRLHPTATQTQTTRPRHQTLDPDTRPRHHQTRPRHYTRHQIPDDLMAPCCHLTTLSLAPYCHLPDSVLHFLFLRPSSALLDLRPPRGGYCHGTARDIRYARRVAFLSLFDIARQIQ